MAITPFRITNSSTDFNSNATVWDLSAVSVPLTLNLQAKTLTLGPNTFALTAYPTEFFFKDTRLKVTLPTFEQTGDKVGEFRLVLQGKVSGEIISDPLLFRSQIDASRISSSLAVYDYSQKRWQFDDQLVTVTGISILQAPLSAQKNIAIIGSELSEFCVAPHTANLVVVIDPRVILDSRMHFDNYAFLRLQGAYDNPNQGTIALMDYQSEIGLIDGTFFGSSLLSLTNSNDAFVGGIQSRPVTVLSSKGEDFLVSRNGQDLLSYWDDFQGAKNPASLPTIRLDMTQGFGVDGYGMTDRVIGFNRIEGSFRNPMDITGHAGNNFFYLYGNGDRVDGGGGQDVIAMDSWDLAYNLKTGRVSNAHQQTLAEFSSIEGVMVQGRVDIIGSDREEIFGFRYGRGGTIEAGGGNDTICFLDSLFGDAFKILINGGPGQDTLYAYARYSDSQVVLNGSGAGLIKFGLSFESYYSKAQQITDARIYNTTVSRGTAELLNIETVRFIDGVLDLTTGIFYSGTPDFSVPNHFFSPFIDRERASDGFSYPSGGPDFNLFAGKDTNVDQLQDRPVTSGAGADLVVSRFASLVDVGPGNDQVAVVGSRSQVLLGPGDDIVAYSQTQVGSSLDAGEGFDIAVFMTLAEYQQSKGTWNARNIECVHVQNWGFEFHLTPGQPARLPFLDLDRAAVDTRFDDFTYQGTVRTAGTAEALFTRHDGSAYYRLPLEDAWVKYDFGTQWSPQAAVAFRPGLQITTLASQTLVLGQPQTSETLELPATATFSVLDIGLYNVALSGSHNLLTAGIERLKLGSTWLALTLEASAGQVAKTLGAVFGKDAVNNKSFVGIGLHFVDDLNFSYPSLMELAINARLGANASSAQVVDLLYTNVVGQAPDAATRKTFTDLLDSGTFTVGGLGVLAADTELNQTNIKLMGLAQTGLAYVPFGG
jgi:hypothetical protein